LKKLIIDVGYSSCKVKFEDKLHKFPTAVAYAIDTGIAFGEGDVVTFKSEEYYVGKEAITMETFNTVDYAFKQNFDPIIIYHILKKLELVDEASRGEIDLTLTLSLTDWRYKEEYLKIVSNFQVDGINFIFNNITLLPQGAGAYMTYMQGKPEHPTSTVIVEIGFNTINLLLYEDGKPQKAHSKGFSGHGVSSIVKAFNTYLESSFSMPFSNSEAQSVFLSGKFMFSGIDRPEVADKIMELKNQFVKRLFNSILTSEKKIMATSEKVILAGGGCYLLEGINFPANVEFINKPYEFGNILSL